MRLRNKLLITFITLGAAPLLVVGWVTNHRNRSDPLKGDRAEL